MAALTYVTRLGLVSGTSTLVLALVLILTLVFYVYFRFYKYSDRVMEMVNKMPGPKSYPIIGTMLAFGTNPKDILQSVSDVAMAYPHIGRYWIGPLLYICAQYPSDVEVVLTSSRLLTKSVAMNMMKCVFGEGLVTSTGEKWKKHRKLLQPTFHAQLLKDFVQTFISKSMVLNDQLEKQVDKDSFDLDRFVSNYLQDTLSETIIATKSNQQLLGEQSEFLSKMRECTSAVSCRFYRPWAYVDYIFYKTPSGKVFKANAEYLINVTTQIIRKKKEKMKILQNMKTNGYKDENGKVKRKSFLEYILEIAPANQLSDNDILDETNTMIMAGFDTSGAAIGFVSLVLSRRFDIQEKIVEEIIEVLGTMEEKAFTYEELHGFKYLDRVVKEILRLYPPVPFIARQITEDTKLPSGYTLPAGSGLIIPFFRLHRDPEVYPNPHVFDPDHFLPERVAGRNPCSYCPFSAGPRGCIGQRYAFLQLKVIVIFLLRRFWLMPTDFRPELLSKITMISENGTRIGVKKRTAQRPFVPDYDRLSKVIHSNIDYFKVEFKDSYL